MKRLITSLLLAVSFIATAHATNTSPISYSLSLASSTYNTDTDTTRFVYWVTSNPAGGPAISHWVISIAPSCGGSEILAGSNDPLATFVENDKPTDGMRGIKFDTGYADGETRTVTVTLNGKWNTGDVAIAVKSGNGFVLGTAQGPVCGGDTAPVLHLLSGNVFFDVNYNGGRNADEIGIGGVTVALWGDGEVVDSTITAADGSYSFLVPTGSYTLIVGGANGMSPTTITEHDANVAGATTAPDTGFGLNFSAISTMSANGFTIGYWKNNLEKALKGATKGTQVSAATLSSHTTTIRELALEPFATLTAHDAVKILSSNSSLPSALLAKQLLASEYNYANGAYLNGDARLTYLFIYFGESVLQNAAAYDATYVLKVKDWMDAYNNTHGGLVLGPSN